MLMYGSTARDCTTPYVPYEEACYMLNFPSLAERRLSMCETLFKQIACESHVLHYLLPAKRDAELTCRMNKIKQYVRGQTVIRTRLYYMHSLTSSATCRFDCMCVCMLVW